MFDYKGRLQRGESLEIAEVPLTFWKPGGEYCILGDYWGKHTLVAGELERVSIERSGSYLQVVVRGSDNPELVKWCETEAEGGVNPEVYVHLCPAGCPRTAIGPNTLHGQQLVPADPAALWLGNMRAFQMKVRAGGERLQEQLAAIAGDHGAGALGKERVSGEGQAEKKRKNLTGDHSFEGSPLDPHLTLKQALKRSRKKRKKKKKGKKTQHQHRRRQLRSLGRIRSPVQGFASDSPHRPTSPGCSSSSRPRGGQQAIGGEFRGRPDKQAKAPFPEIHEVAHHEQTARPRSEERSANPGVLLRQAGSERHSRLPRHLSAALEGHRISSGRCFVAGGSEYGAGAFGAGENQRPIRSPRGDEVFQNRLQGLAGLGERVQGLESEGRGQREVCRERKGRRERSQGRSKRQRRSRTRGSSSPPLKHRDPGSPLPRKVGVSCASAAGQRSGPLADAAVGAEPPVGSEGLDESSFEFPLSSKWLGSSIRDLILGRCLQSSFGIWLKKFCEGTEGLTAGKTHGRDDIFPLPLPGPKSSSSTTSKDDPEASWMLISVASLN